MTILSAITTPYIQPAGTLDSGFDTVSKRYLEDEEVVAQFDDLEDVELDDIEGVEFDI